MITEALSQRFYPDDRRNGTRIFYSWLQGELRPDMRALNIGAGPATKDPDRNMKGRVGAMVGIDVDPVVLENEELHEACLIDMGRFPLPDASFDCAFADNVLEHVDDPEAFLSETYRVLKPGASFYFRTPNLGHYVAMISWLTPHWFHELVANRVRGMPAEAHDPWPTHYRMNTRSTLTRLAKQAGFRGMAFRMMEPDPSYLKFNGLAFRAGVAYERLVNSSELFAPFRANILGRLTK